MNLKESYFFMYGFFSNYYFMTHHDEMGALLGEFTILEDGIPGDPAAWEDWSESVQKITKRKQITEDEALQAMLVLMKEYNDHQGLSLKKVIKYLEKTINVIAKQKELAYQKYLAAISKKNITK